MAENINAVLMLEILGRPPEHIKKTISELVDKMSKEKNVKIVEKKIAKPKKLEGKDVFTSYAEIEIETNMETLMLLIFGYMPSHVEIITPEEIKIKNNNLNMFFNELTKKLHQYDEIAQTLIMERKMLAKQIQEGKIKIVKQEKGKKSGKSSKKKKN